MTTDFLRLEVLPLMRSEVSTYTQKYQTDLSYDVEDLMDADSKGALTDVVWMVRKLGTFLFIKRENESYEDFEYKQSVYRTAMEDDIVHEFKFNFELGSIEKVGE